MTKNKDLKRRVRARMAKTGESYTTARAHLLGHPLPPLPANHAELVPQSDDVITERTGQGWAAWVRELDEVGATEMSHAATVKWLTGERGIDGWWAQTLTVGYERLRGLRDIGQRRGGGYEINKSRTVNVPLDALFDAFTDADVRARWLDHDLHVRGATRGKTVRIDWPDGTNVVAGFMDKGPAKAAVAVQHSKLPDREAAAEMRAFWGERLDGLKAMLEGG